MLLCIFDLETAFSHLFYCLFQFFPQEYYKCLWISTGSDSMSCWCLILIKNFVSCAFIYFYIVLKTSILMQLYTCTCKSVISITIMIATNQSFYKQSSFLWIAWKERSNNVSKTLYKLEFPKIRRRVICGKTSFKVRIKQFVSNHK